MSCIFWEEKVQRGRGTKWKDHVVTDLIGDVGAFAALIGNISQICIFVNKWGMLLLNCVIRKPSSNALRNSSVLTGLNTRVKVSWSIPLPSEKT